MHVETCCTRALWRKDIWRTGRCIDLPTAVHARCHARWRHGYCNAGCAPFLAGQQQTPHMLQIKLIDHQHYGIKATGSANMLRSPKRIANVARVGKHKLARINAHPLEMIMAR